MRQTRLVCHKPLIEEEEPNEEEKRRTRLLRLDFLPMQMTH